MRLMVAYAEPSRMLSALASALNLTALSCTRRVASPSASSVSTESRVALCVESNARTCALVASLSHVDDGVGDGAVELPLTTPLLPLNDTFIQISTARKMPTKMLPNTMLGPS
jgi:hypothetical protein